MRLMYLKSNFIMPFAIFITIAFVAVYCKKPHHDQECDGKPIVSVNVFATGLDNPRGLKFGPDGNLYVAEAGKGGTDSDLTKCAQPPALKPFLGSKTGGSISMISNTGVVTKVTDQLPSTTSNNGQGAIMGASDVVFLNNNLFVLTSGGGCSHSVPSIPNGIFRVKSNGSTSVFADLSSYRQSHPVAHPEPNDIQLDGTWYSMILVGNDFYALDPNQGELVKINSSGTISRLIDISASQGHIVPTALAYYNGSFYVGNLGLFPATPGESKIYKISSNGNIQVWKTGFNMILGLVFDDQGRLYVLENTVGAPFPTPGKGQIERINSAGERETIVTGLTLPTGITIGPDNKLYVSANGLGPTGIGGGQVLRISVKDCDGNNGSSYR